jgi:hypothetical protein
MPATQLQFHKSNSSWPVTVLEAARRSVAEARAPGAPPPADPSRVWTECSQVNQGGALMAELCQPRTPLMGCPLGRPRILAPSSTPGSSGSASTPTSESQLHLHGLPFREVAGLAEVRLWFGGLAHPQHRQHGFFRKAVLRSLL